MPQDLSDIPGTSFAWFYRPCDELAGDGLGVISFGGDKVGLYLLDVSGHGVASALLSVAMSRLLSAPPEPSSILVGKRDVQDQCQPTPPPEVAAHLNQLFPFDAATEQLTTMVYGILDVADGAFRYVSAGHPNPVHLPADAGPSLLESDGFPLGLTDEPYEERAVQLAPGDRLYLYSDGVPEAMNTEGEEFGVARLLEAISDGGSETLSESVARIETEIAKWHGKERPKDDISVLAVEISLHKTLP